jgi:zinc transporter, ZIP family
MTAMRWVALFAPLAMIAALLVWIVLSHPGRAVGGSELPPVERLTFQRVTLEPGAIVATLLNDGPDRVVIAQVQVDDAFWTFESDRGQSLGHLGQTTFRIPYPWVEGEAHVVRVLTSTGAAFEHEIGVAVETPTVNFRQAATFALIGLYVGVLPVAIGLLWFPFLRRLSPRGMDFLLALTIGLLAFLLVDGAHEGLEAAGELPSSLQGTALFIAAAAAAFIGLEALGTRLRRRSAPAAGAVLALLVAIGIGVHNFGEGLAIGSAFALGEATLGTLLIVGFTLHNTTEGLAIVAPLARAGERANVRLLAQLGAIGGFPTIVGAWVGGFVYSPVWAVVFLGVGVGAIAQVVAQIGRQVGRATPSPTLASGPVLSGLVAGFAVMYVTGMLVG